MEVIKSKNKTEVSAERRFRSLVDTAIDAIVILDLDTGLFVEEANPSAEALFGLSRDELLGHYGPQHLSPEFQPDGERSIDRITAVTQNALTGMVLSFEWMHQNVRGVHVPCHITLSRFPDPERHLIRASIVDLTERKLEETARLKLETQLAQIQKFESIGQLTGGVAHDFNNLLNIIMVNLELLALKVDPDEETSDLINAALEATIKGATLTKSMLSYARRAPLQPTVIKLSSVVHSMETLFSRTIPANISIDTTVVDEKSVNADTSGIESALLNLVLNARDAMPQGGKLKITVSTTEITEESDEPEAITGHYVVLCVSDSGAGISAVDMSKVFDPFYSTKSAAGNSGLGLSTVLGFMKQSGGTVQIKSEKDIGTEVRLFFPASDDNEDQSKTFVTAAQSNLKAARILVAEDQAEVRNVIRKALELCGHDVVTAINGDEALEIYTEASGIELLITDIVMPGAMQGSSLAEHLRDITPDLPVIFISGYTPDVENSIMKNGKKDTRLTKPFSMTELEKAVNEALEP